MSVWWAFLLGCGSPSIQGVPEGAIHIRALGDEVHVDGQRVGSMAVVNANPRGNEDASVAEALRRHAGKAVWIELPGSMTFVATRRFVNSARAAKAGRVVPSADGGERAVPLGDSPRYGLAGTCKDGPLAVTGAVPLITVSVEQGRDGNWLIGSARFLPLVDRNGIEQPVEGLPTRCLGIPACDALYQDPALHAACQAGEGAAEAPIRVRLGGPTGCMAPIASDPSELAKWPPVVDSLVRTLGLAEQPLVVVMPEASVRHDALVAVLDGFQRGGAGPVSVGTTLLIEGNDGAPICNAPVRDAAALAAAGARWLGGVRGELAARSAERQ